MTGSIVLVMAEAPPHHRHSPVGVKADQKNGSEKSLERNRLNCASRHASARCSPARHRRINSVISSVVALSLTFQWLASTVSAPAMRKIRVFFKNAQNLLAGLWVLVRDVAGRNDILRDCAIHVRTPIRHDAVTGIGRITTAAVADDRVVGHTWRHRNRVHSIEKTAFRREAVHAIGAAHRFELFLPNVCYAKHLLARLTAQRWVANDQRCKGPNQATCQVAPAQWCSNKDHTANFRSVSKEEFLPKVLARFRGKRYFIGRPAEDFHPKLIPAVSKKQPANAAAHAVSDHHHGFQLRKLLLYFIKFFA